MAFGFQACLAAANRLRRYARLLRRHTQFHRQIARRFRQHVLRQPVAPDALDQDNPPSFFEILPPEVRNIIFEYAFGELLSLRPAIPKPKEKPHPDVCLRIFQTVSAAVSPAIIVPPLIASRKLASLIVSTQWKVEVEPFLKPDATYDVSEHHRLKCLQPKWSFENFRFVKHIVISHLSVPILPFQDMPNLESCVIHRQYSRHWLDPLRFLYEPDGSLPTALPLITANPVEFLMHIDFSRYLDMWYRIQKKTRCAGTHPKFTCKGSLRQHKVPSDVAFHTVSYLPFPMCTHLSTDQSSRIIPLICRPGISTSKADAATEVARSYRQLTWCELLKRILRVY